MRSCAIIIRRTKIRQTATIKTSEEKTKLNGLIGAFGPGACTQHSPNETRKIKNNVEKAK